jgi:hypothetical protein
MEGNDAFAWAVEQGLLAKMPKRLNQEESTDERRLREANPDLPTVSDVTQLYSVAGTTIFQREMRLFKATPAEAHASMHNAVGELLTEDEQRCLLEQGETVRKERERKEANRAKAQRHREKFALTGEHILMERWPEGWTEEDVSRHLSPPQSTETAPELSPDEARKARERDKKRAQRAKPKQPIEGSNEPVDPPLAPIAYRQKVAAIRTKIGLASLMSYEDLEKVEAFLDCMIEGWESDE